MTRIALQVVQTEATDVRDVSSVNEDARTGRPHGKQYWRSLAEFAGEEAQPSGLGCQGAFEEDAAAREAGERREGGERQAPRDTDEFAPGASHWPANLSRRRFLQLSAASMALAGLHGCSRQPEEHIVPYVRQPEHVVPGRPMYYATALVTGPYATGVLVESHEGRPTKIEGNPEHPASLGASDAVTQAQVLSVYDPDRSQAVRHRGRFSSWNACFTELDDAMRRWRGNDGEGLRVLTGSVTSPTLADQLRRLTERYPKAKWHQFEPVNRDAARQGALLAFGRDVHTLYDFSKAKRVLSLDADFMLNGAAPVRYARDFMAGRRVRSAGADDALLRAETMNRLYVVETMPGVTGSTADHRFAATPDEIAAIARMLAQRLGVSIEGGGGSDTDAGEAGNASAGAPPWLDAVVRDLEKHKGASIVIAGDHQPPAVHALVHAINAALENIGETVTHTEPVEARGESHRESLAALCDAIDASEVDTLLILGGNPVYDAPADRNFLDRLRTVPLRIHHGLYFNETANHCHWHMPATHPLESWSDARAFDGTVSIVQPLIQPLYEGRGVHEVVSYLLDAPNLDAHQIVQRYWRQRRGEDGFERFWKKSLHEGLVPDTAAKIVEDLQVQSPLVMNSGGTGVSPVTRGRDAGATAQFDTTSTSSRATASVDDNNTVTVAIRPDPFILDGRFANNGWLQELPKPVTTLTWDNAVLISATTAKRLRVENTDVVKLTAGDREVQGPVWVVPGHADGCATIHLGYGRPRAGNVGNRAGFDAYQLQTSDSPWLAREVTVTRGKGRLPLAVTQSHHQMEGRDLVRAGSLDDFHKDPALEPPITHDPIHVSLYEDADHPHSDANQWGMVIDLGACTGCNACTAACQAENNIPVVGKPQVLVGREMHWIRVDRYYEGDAASPTAMHHQPVPCMHCENAPCEVVCPVNATVHNFEGLNDMVYNRCIGTRYCSNNCPYKVRRFNFLEYHDRDTDVLKLGRNPDVSVRSRGVMEKCTYCVQRISSARIEAKKNATGEKPPGFVEDGALLTACQQACPTQAIVFGNLLDENSQVRQLADQPHNYGLLEDLNTKPRTTYLGKVKNLNKEISREP